MSKRTYSGLQKVCSAEMNTKRGSKRWFDRKRDTIYKREIINEYLGGKTFSNHFFVTSTRVTSVHESSSYNYRLM